MVPALKAELERFDDRVELALLYGSVARGEEKSGSDVDLMIVGSLKQIDLLPALRKLESRFSRDVNITLFSSEEFHRKLAAGDHFLKTVLKGKNIFLKGELDELEENCFKRIRSIDRTSIQELTEIRRLVARDLADIPERY